MDSEELKITQEACDIVNKAKAKKKRICAVGTTSMRAIESSVSSARTLNQFEGWTNKFIFPPHDFSVANCMITNFHTPKSTLIDDGFSILWSRFDERSLCRSHQRRV